MNRKSESPILKIKDVLAESAGNVEMFTHAGEPYLFVTNANRGVEVCSTESGWWIELVENIDDDGGTPTRDVNVRSDEELLREVKTWLDT